MPGGGRTLGGILIVMTEAEFTILDYLQGSPETFFARKEIARRAVRRQIYEENQHWADAPLAALLLKGLIEQNEGGLYRLKKSEVLP
jgi:hypothetical protein